MKTVFKILLAIVPGLIIGVGIGVKFTSGALGSGGEASTVTVKQWTSDWSIGSQAASPRLRAGIARRGLLALAKSEAVYFTANVDDAGRPLTQDCNYTVSGTGQDASWWSITLYDSDSRLPMNTDEALSFDATQATEGSWTATISTLEPENGPWISSKAAGQFDLTLRLYEPFKAVLNTPETTVNAPSIKREGCHAGAAS